jgi:hypothetical protein
VHPTSLFSRPTYIPEPTVNDKDECLQGHSCGRSSPTEVSSGRAETNDPVSLSRYGEPARQRKTILSKLPLKSTVRCQMCIWNPGQPAPNFRARLGQYQPCDQPLPKKWLIATTRYMQELTLGIHELQFQHRRSGVGAYVSPLLLSRALASSMVGVGAFSFFCPNILFIAPVSGENQRCRSARTVTAMINSFLSHPVGASSRERTQLSTNLDTQVLCINTPVKRQQQTFRGLRN